MASGNAIKAPRVNSQLCTSITPIKHIMVMKGLTKKVGNENYPKHSLVHNILFASNFKNVFGPVVSDDEDDEYVMDVEQLIDTPNDDTTRVEQIWVEIKNHLDETDIDFIQEFLEIQKNKKVGRYSNDIKQKYSKLERKIKRVVKKNKINIY